MKHRIAPLICLLAALSLCTACNEREDRDSQGNLPRTERSPDFGGPSGEDQVATDELSPQDTSPTETASEAPSESADPAEEPLPSPPYITLGQQTQPGEIILCEGQPVPVYYELATDTPKTCWVALVLAQTESKLACDNEKLAIQKQPLPGDRMGQVTFIMPQPGEYRLRLFTSGDDHAEYASEAQPFRVVSKEKWAELGKQGKNVSPQ